MSQTRDEREVVNVEQADGYERSTRVVRDAKTERNHFIARVNAFIWLLFGILISVIGLRVILRMIGANQANDFANFINTVTEPFLTPFFGLLGTPAAGAAAIELSSIVAMVVYILLAFVITQLIRIVFAKSSARRVTQVERERLP